MKKLAFGLMRLPLLDMNDPTSIDIEHAKKMTDIFIERGFTYFDTAWMYHDFKSEEAVKEFLVDRYPRDAYTLTTKLHAAFFESLEEGEKMFRDQLEKTGVTYFDYYLLHDMNADYYDKYEKYGLFDWIRQKKEEGLIKHYGFSFHDNADLLDKILTEHPGVEFVQLQLNYLDWESPYIQSRRCYEVARKHGKDIFVMEPVKGGVLAMLPDRAADKLRAIHPDWSFAEWAIKFVASLPGVKLVLSGMSNLEQMNDNTSFMQSFDEAQNKLTDGEVKALEECVDIINSDIKVACTGCSYCTDGCPAHIPIPMYFSLYNADSREDPDRKALFTTQSIYYEALAQKHPKASACMHCEQCELICPQHLPVMSCLEEVAKRFEG